MNSSINNRESDNPQNGNKHVLALVVRSINLSLGHACEENLFNYSFSIPFSSISFKSFWGRGELTLFRLSYYSEMY